METIINSFIMIPLVGFLISFFIPERNEKALSIITFSTVGLQMLASVVFVIYWFSIGHPVINVKDLVLFRSEGYEFYIDLMFDKITLTYLLVGALLTFLVTIYSRYYLHREKGYKRFFNTVLFFYLGYNVVIFSGNLETMFIGWEILGISSFLLIAFYRERYLPVKNAVKVFSIYRIGDVGLVLAMWMSHHLFYENITFMNMKNFQLVHEHLQGHSLIGIFISMMILLSAAAKSAQLPFSSWLPRAMEGPTPSSAIFYGSLSVHIGIFVLLRTYPFWEHQTAVRVLIGLLGLVTSVVATMIARVQSSVKSQIAYSSIAQIGLIFIEVSAGLHDLALFHFAGNAFLRTYQLLVSPSVVSYLIREQFYNFVPREKTIEDSLPRRLEYSFYILSLKEWNLDDILHKVLWGPLHKIGHKLDFLSYSQLIKIFVPTFILGLGVLFYQDSILPEIHNVLPTVFAFIGLIMVLKSFSERRNVLMSWTLIIMNHFWITLAISFNEHYEYNENILYLSGVIISGVVGYFCLRKLRTSENIDLDQFHGHSYEHPRLSFVFLLACLGLTGFPLTPTFIGEDLIFSHIHEDQILLAILTSLSFIIDGLALIRIYARVFLGPHSKSYHEVAYRSS